MPNAGNNFIPQPYVWFKYSHMQNYFFPTQISILLII